jgi:hypothetical protein
MLTEPVRMGSTHAGHLHILRRSLKIRLSKLMSPIQFQSSFYQTNITKTQFSRTKGILR